MVNLEVLWVHDNQLRAINCLEHNTRIKQLYAHNNRLCTLRGSITKLKFLTHLDISHNQLKRLDKVVGTLQKLRFLQELNLQVSLTTCHMCMRHPEAWVCRQNLESAPAPACAEKPPAPAPVAITDLGGHFLSALQPFGPSPSTSAKLPTNKLCPACCTAGQPLL